MSERDKIVRYLKHAARNAPDSFSMFASGTGGLVESPGGAIERLAREIERGDHLVWKPKPTIPAETWMKTPSVGH